MKTIIQRIVGMTALCMALSAAAQTEPTAEDTTTAQLIPWSQLPAMGTFWVEGPSGFTAPLPCRPQDMPGASDYALSDGSFVVDERTVKNYALLSMSAMSSIAPPPPPTGGSHTNSLPKPKLLIVTSNAWFNHIVISNHTYVSLNGVTLDGNGNVMTQQLPFGGMFAVTATNLTTPMTHWKPVGITNAIGNTNFILPYNPASTPISFYRISAELDTNDNPAEILPFSVMASNVSILADQGVTLMWTNRQPGRGNEFDVIVENDTNGHSYLVGTTTTTGASNSFSFELTVATNLQFVNYALPAPITQDEFFLIRSNFNTPDVVTVPYVINTNSGRSIIEVAAYDVTDSSNPQFLSHVTGNGCDTGTLEIPGVSMSSGVDTLEFRAIDSGFGQSATDITITNSRLVSIVSPVLSLVPDGTNRIAASGGGYGISFEAATTATNGTWVVNVYDPAGNLFESWSTNVTSIGQTIIYDDGSTVNSVYPAPYYDVAVTVQPPGNHPLAQNDPPAQVNTHYIRIYIVPPKPSAGSITAYDGTVINELGNSDQQYALSVLSGGISQMFEFVYYIENIQNNGVWQTVNQPMANNLNAPFGWTALNAGLADSTYYPGGQQQTPDRPILGVMVHGHGGLLNGVAMGLQGPRDDDQLSEASLAQFHFNKQTNAVALAIFTGCQIGNSPFMEYILRDNGVPGQFTPNTALAKKIRPCFGLGWNYNVPNNTDIFDWLTYFTLYATQNNGSSFTYSLDQAVSQANQNAPGSGSTGVVWSGEQGAALDSLSQ